MAERSALAPGGEFDLIRRFLRPAQRPARADVAVGPGDDCAVVEGRRIALSVDMSVEGIHFRREWLSAHAIGYRAAAAALSDLAAVAARPIGVLAALALPEAAAGAFGVELMRGVTAAADRVGAVLLGGDLTRSPGHVTIDVTVVGELTVPVLRSGAEPGDEVWVTGELGGAALAVELLLRGEDPPLAALERFTSPLPRCAEACWLVDRSLPTAMLDLSDGLVGDARHISAASGVAIVLERGEVPIHPSLLDRVGGVSAHHLATSGGEDYELLFSARPGAVAQLLADFRAAFGIELTRIGRVEEGDGVYWRGGDGERVRAAEAGYQHFGPAAADSSTL